MKVTEINVKTGEILKRDMTDSEKEMFNAPENAAPNVPIAPTPEQRLDAVEAETKSVRSDVDALSIIITGKEASHHGNQ